MHTTDPAPQIINGIRNIWYDDVAGQVLNDNHND